MAQPSTPPAPAPTLPPAGKVSDDEVRASIPNFWETVERFSVATGVSTRHTRIVTAYAQAKSRLPMDNDVLSFGIAQHLAYVQLAAEFCNTALTDQMALPATQRREPYRSLNLTLTQLTLEQKTMIVNAFAQDHWRRDPRASETAALITAFDEIAASTPTNAIRTAVLGVCIDTLTALASLSN